MLLKDRDTAFRQKCHLTHYSELRCYTDNWKCVCVCARAHLYIFVCLSPFASLSLSPSLSLCVSLFFSVSTSQFLSVSLFPPSLSLFSPLPPAPMNSISIFCSSRRSALKETCCAPSRLWKASSTHAPRSWSVETVAFEPCHTLGQCQSAEKGPGLLCGKMSWFLFSLLAPAQQQRSFFVI